MKLISAYLRTAVADGSNAQVGGMHACPVCSVLACLSLRLTLLVCSCYGQPNAGAFFSWRLNSIPLSPCLPMFRPVT